VFQLAGHPRQKGGTHRHLRHERRILDHDRNADGVVDRLEVLEDAVRVRFEEIRRQYHHGVGALGLCLAAQRDGDIRPGISGTHDERHPAFDLADDQPQQLNPFIARERVPLARGAEQTQAMRAAVQEKPDQPHLAVRIKAAIFVERRVDNGEDAGEI
jgi:hypothetical protein